MPLCIFKSPFAIDSLKKNYHTEQARRHVLLAELDKGFQFERMLLWMTVLVVPYQNEKDDAEPE